MDKSLRLRLVVRRNGLPDTRILFNVPLGHDPTIANLVELVNETIPLETEEWGLDDYAVELHDKDSNAFECLHFQPVASILDKDDEVFIRPLLTTDLKKRRLGGRTQVTHGGQHLVDGVPYGRPRLRTTRGRPVVHIAPRKRRRLTYDGDFGQYDLEMDNLNGGDDDDDDDDDDQGSGERHIGAGKTQLNEEDEERLLLTQKGESVLRGKRRRVRFPCSMTGSALDPDAHAVTNVDADVEAEDSEGEDDISGSEDEEDEEDDLQEELRVLSEEAAANGPSSGGVQEQERSHPPHGDVEPVGGSSASRRQVNDFGPSSHDDNRHGSRVHHGPQSMVTTPQLDINLIDKITAIRAAFPVVSTVYCEELLIKHNGDVSSVWKKLAQQVRPRMDLAHTMVLNTQLELPNEIQIMSSPPRKPAEFPGEVSRIEEDGDGISSGASSSEEEEEDADEQKSSFEAKGADENDSDSDSNDSPGDSAKSPSPSVELDDSSNDSSSSGSESEESESQSKSESQHSSPSQTRKQEQEQKQDNADSSDGSSGLGGCLQKRITSRRRWNVVVESSPKSSQATNGKAGTARGASKTLNKVALPPNDPDSSSEESDQESGEKAGSGSSSSSSETDSDSSSDSESDDQASTPSKTKNTSITARTTSIPTALCSRLAPPSAPQASARALVPPGQGSTRTQKRNARRRLQKQRQASSGDEAAPEDTEAIRASDTALIARKAELLRSLGTSDALYEQSEETASCNNDPEAWRQKISYRAVECVNEGVELSEPPFPFVQRWDPQQRQRRGKRKSRNDTQLYEEPSQHSAKKIRFERSGQLVDGCQDDTTCMMDQGDVTLNYDDVSLDPEEGSMANDNITGQAKYNQPTEDDKDDLPLLPEDLSSMSSLRPEDLRPKMVIAWKQLLMSKATNWQPTMSDFLTAIVIEAGENGRDLRVQLAKRDRDVDKTEKEYDDEGERIYGKFEAPDDDDAEEDLGFRDLSLVQMTDPRIVRQPAQPATKEKAPKLPELVIEVARSQSVHNGDAETCDSKDSHGNKSSSNSDQSTALENENFGQGQGQHDQASTGADAAGESFITDTDHDIDIDDEDEVGDPARLIKPCEQVSISNKRREEISQLINDGGFRQEVRSSIDQSAFLRLGSPSRQLEEEASSVLYPRQLDSPQRSSSEEAPSEYDTKDSSEQSSRLPAPQPARDNFHSASQSPSHALDNREASGSVNSNGRIEYPSLNVSFTSQMSAQSGRFEPNFVAYSDDLGMEPIDDLVLMSNGDALRDDSNGPDIGPGEACRGDRERTPSQQVYNDDLHHATNTKAVVTPLKSTQLGPEDIGPPGSDGSNSTRSSSIFLDLELLGSQPVKSKFQEQVKEEPISTQVEVKGELLSQSAQRMSQLRSIDEAESLWAASSRWPEKDMRFSTNVAPRSSRQDRRVISLAQEGRQSPPAAGGDGSPSSQRTRWVNHLAALRSSPSAATTKIPANGKNNSVDGNLTPKCISKSFVASFDASVSPPSRSSPRQHKGSASTATSSQERRNPFTEASQLNLNAAGKVSTSCDHTKMTYKPLKGSRMVSLLTRSPAPEEHEAEPEEEAGSEAEPNPTVDSDSDSIFFVKDDPAEAKPIYTEP